MSRALIARISDAMNCPIKDAETIEKVFTQCVKDEVAQKGGLTIKDFGTFGIKHLKRTCVLNKKTYKIDKNYIKFKASKKFNEAVR